MKIKKNLFINQYPDTNYIEEIKQRNYSLESMFLLELAYFRKNMLDSIAKLSLQYKVEVSGELRNMIRHCL